MKGFVGRLIFIFFSAVMIAELLCRVFVPEYQRDLMTVNQDGHRVNRSNFNSQLYSHVNDRGYTWVFSDEKGRRLPQTPPVNKGGKSLKIAFMGDSLTFGLHVEAKDSYPEVLGRLLQERFPDRVIQIINCSVVAANLAELYAIYMTVCGDNDIDLFIVQGTVSDRFGSYSLLGGEVYGPDIQMLSYGYQCSAALLKNKIEMRKGDRSLNFLGKRKSFVSYYREAFGSRLPLYAQSQLMRKFEHNFITDFKFRCRGQKFPFLFGKNAKHVFDSSLKHYGLVPGKVPDINFTVTLLERWRAELEQKGAKFLIFNLPNVYGLNIFLEKEKDYRVHFDEYLRLLSQKGIDHFELTSIQTKDNYQSLYFKDDVHFNELGYKMVAAELLSKVESILR